MIPQADCTRRLHTRLAQADCTPIEPVLLFERVPGEVAQQPVVHAERRPPAVVVGAPQPAELAKRRVVAGPQAKPRWVDVYAKVQPEATLPVGQAGRLGTRR